MEQPNVRRAIETHLLDSSSAVRDAAVELIGKYIIESPEFAEDYFQKIIERIAVRGSPAFAVKPSLRPGMLGYWPRRPQACDQVIEIVLLGYNGTFSPC